MTRAARTTAARSNLDRLVRGAALAALIPVATPAAFPGETPVETSIDFARDVQPLLANHCFACHGPDEATRKAGLRLDTPDGAAALLRSGNRAVVAGEPDLSELLTRIESDDARQRMPPEKFGKPLGDAQRATLRRWIEQGGAYRRHWSFVAPVQAPLPAVQDAAWPRAPLDHFVLARLEAQQLSPSPEAPRETLLRRASLALTGLPPTPGEQAAFLADARPDAYERAVDVLLASTRAAEHQARLWLDLARYGDTHGYHLDNERALWRWRDWVIEAFERNLPYDQFTVEQLAGDLLPDATDAQRLATGFLRCNPTTGEGGLIEEEYLVKYAVDRVNTLGQVWLGLTVGCAQCHDHKFDPLSQRDYYGLFAFLNGIAEKGTDENALLPQPAMKAPRAEEAAARAKLAAALDAATAAAAAPRGDLERLLPAWEAAARDEAAKRFAPLAVARHSADHATVRERQADGSWLAVGPSPAREVERFEIDAAALALPASLTALRLEALVDPSLPGGGPGRFENGNFVLTGFAAERVGADGRAEPLAFARAVADHQQENFPPSLALDGDTGSGWAILPQLSSHQALFVLAEPLALAAGDRLRVTLRHESQFERHVIGRVRLSASGDAALQAPEFDAAALARTLELDALLALPADRRDAAAQERVARELRRRNDASWRALDDRRAALAADLAAFDAALPSAMVAAELATPRPTYLLRRGQYDQKGEPIAPALPAALGRLADGEKGDRLALARWLVRRDHPLTARVVVNRVWAQLFGSGLVKTAEDFGAQGSPPSHPELLDWLAVDLLDHGFDLRRLHRQLVTSATFRQSSRVTPESLALDRDARLLSRMPRLRLDAEVIRDGALAASGLLVEQVGGRSVKPYQPGDLWKVIAYPTSNTATFVQDHGDALWRRSLYTFWKRTSPPPNLAAFDAPSRESCTVQRARTNTPLQALVLLNDVQFVEAARVLAQRLLREGGCDAATRVRLAWQLVLGRAPRPAELERALAAVAREQANFAAEPERAALLLAQGEAPLDASAPPAELAAWTLLSSTLINLDEFVTRE
ncbi:MAG: PSD1 domain-containing protein [Planctomycetes bacterium]|nr:PSD1 domain-containing protein [Planctomycetota bacterium]